MRKKEKRKKSGSMGFKEFPRPLAPWIGGCHGRIGEDGRLGERQKGTGKEQRGKARITENVPGNLNPRPAPAGLFLIPYTAIHKFMLK